MRKFLIQILAALMLNAGASIAIACTSKSFIKPTKQAASVNEQAGPSFHPLYTTTSYIR